MSDGILITAGAGTTVATDDVSNMHYQVVKVGLGANNAVDGHWSSASQIGSVTATLAAGAAVIGSVSILNQPALVAGAAVIGSVSVLNQPALVAGNAVIGSVSVLNQPALVAGSAQVGSVTVNQAAAGVTLPWAVELRASVVSTATTVVTVAGVANTALLAAPGAGVRWFISDITITNAGATACQGSLLDGATTKYAGYLAATGGGFDHTFARPLPMTAATTVNANCSATSSVVFAIAGYTASAA